MICPHCERSTNDPATRVVAEGPVWMPLAFFIEVRKAVAEATCCLDDIVEGHTGVGDALEGAEKNLLQALHSIQHLRRNHGKA